MIIGRNFQIRDIVMFLNSSLYRLIHVHGPEGHGKCEISNYAAKYALYGRVNLEGALFVSSGENNDELNLIVSYVCRNLMMMFNYHEIN